MDENNTHLENNSDSTPSSYGAPKAGEYGVDKPQEAAASNDSATTSEASTSDDSATTSKAAASDVSTKISESDTAGNAETSATSSAFSLASDNVTSGSSSEVSTTGQSSAGSSHQEVFGGSVEGTPTNTGNYYTNNNSPYSPAAEEIPKGFAIASLVMGILSILTCCCCIGILFGILGIIFYCVQEKDSVGKRPTQATVGLILSIVGLVIGVVGIILGVVMSGSSEYQNMFNNL